MKLLLIISLVLISTASVAAGRQRRLHSSTVTRAASQTNSSTAMLTRVQKNQAERRLSELGYWTGTVDGRIDEATRSALIAFQKWEARPVTGQLTLDELEAIRVGVSPRARELGYYHVEIDVDRQVLLIVNDDGSVGVLPVSTGSDKPFMDDGQMSIAYTPRGRFVVYDKIIGWEKGEFSAMYYSNYISGGVAIHGYHSVPTVPASHGCIRIPIFAARNVSKLLKLGTIVLVYDKVSFVSARDWASNPQLKQAALASSALPDYD